MTDTTTVHTMSLRMPPELYDALVVWAGVEDLTLAQAVRRAIRETIDDARVRGKVTR